MALTTLRRFLEPSDLPTASRMPKTRARAKGRVRHGAKPSDAKDSNDPIDPKRTAAKSEGKCAERSEENLAEGEPEVMARPKVAAEGGR